MTDGPRSRWIHLKGQNPYVLAREHAEAASRYAGARHDITGELPAIVLAEPPPIERPTPPAAEDATAAAVTTTGRLVRSSAGVGIGTALSRVTGLLRTVALTYALGATLVADSYNLANTTPNMVYDLLLGGVLSATLVPVFVERFEHDDDDGVSAVISVAVAALVALTVVAVIAAPLIFRLYTWQADPAEAMQLTRTGVPLLRLFLPQVLFYGLTALATALLNARRRFAAPAFAPVLNNLVVIGVLVWFARVAGRNPTTDGLAASTLQLWLLGLGTTAGIVAMTVALWPAVRATGVRLRWRPRWRDPAVRTVASLSGWTLGYVVANQVALVVALALAARQEGGASAYTYAFVFFQLPFGLFAVSVMTTFTPDLSSAASARDAGRFRERFALGTRLITLVVLPSSIGYVVLARPLVSVLLSHGSFTGSAPQLTADVLVCFAVGLIGFSIYLFALRGFYAMHDTRTPFFLNVFENALNIAIAFALVGRWGVQGVAFSYSVAYLLAGVVALVALGRRIGGLGGRDLGLPVARIFAASAVMGAAVWASTRAIGAESGGGAIVRIVAAVVVGAVVYGAAALVLRVEDVRTAVARLRR
ncbi:MAG: murein biosynthesis integral membrane protein MurJ [Acidimicrobiales bacterium]